MDEVKLFCAVVGAPESAFPVDIDAGQSLFLAKKGNAWLSAESEAALGLVKGEVHEDIRILINGEQMLAP
ncbi:hypothetical protein V7S43_014327 [Phytophthora oleae]|uniref:Uncharacterized protein n=1 Tax=Phytophthora oleae TaxID=2107226 RepID=A0ABD3F192_9STRA